MGKIFRILACKIYINSASPYVLGSFSSLVPPPSLTPCPSRPGTTPRPPTGDRVPYQHPIPLTTSLSQTKMGRSFDETVDPLARITAPPVNETLEERQTRERKEADAKKISEQIDAALKAEREEGKFKRKRRLKVLLLGQSESGAFTSQDPPSFPAALPHDWVWLRKFQISWRISQIHPASIIQHVRRWVMPNPPCRVGLIPAIDFRIYGRIWGVFRLASSPFVITRMRESRLVESWETMSRLFTRPFAHAFFISAEFPSTPHFQSFSHLSK